MLFNVISVCSIKDLETWCVVAQFLPRMVRAQHYTLVVPNKDFAIFRDKTPTTIDVIPENQIIEATIIEILRDNTSRHNNNRYGWYLQQIIKLEILARTPANRVSLVWDADTVPITPLDFERQDQLCFFVGREKHKPYFDCINRLIGESKQLEYSFIAQCLPYKGVWMLEFIKTIETIHGKPWINAIIDCIDFSQGAGFSEYETLGTFALNNFRNKMHFNKSLWCRRGNSIFGSIHRLTEQRANLFSRRYAFVSFESWNRKRRLFLPDIFIKLLHWRTKQLPSVRI